MNQEELVESLKGQILPLLEQEGAELIDLTARREGRNLFLRVFIDKPQNGITLGECSRLNREIGMILEEKNILNENYILEVSSPGLDRPLSEARDFARCIGKKVKIFLKEMILGKLEWDGIIKEVRDGMVFIDIGDNILEIAISKINKAKQLIGD